MRDVAEIIYELLMAPIQVVAGIALWLAVLWFGGVMCKHLKSTWR